MCCSVLQCVAVCCGMLQFGCDAMTCVRVKTKCLLCRNCNALQRTNAPQRTATHCNALQRTATYCNALQRIKMHCNALHHNCTTTATQLQHTATHCNVMCTMTFAEIKDQVTILPELIVVASKPCAVLMHVISASPCMLSPAWCNVLQHVVACCSVLVSMHIVSASTCTLSPMCCSVLQRVAVCCSVLRCTHNLLSNSRRTYVTLRSSFGAVHVHLNTYIRIIARR